MTHGRWRFSALAALSVLAGFSASPEAALAQNGGSPPAASTVGAPRLPSEVFAANPVTPEQIRLIEAVAELWVPQLRGDGATEGNESQVVNARNELIQPLSFPGVSADFRTQYSRIVSKRLVGALDPNQPLLHRLNTMIVASRLELDANVFALILQGLDDPSPAVRYWAVKACGGRAEGAFDAQQLNQIFARLEQMVAAEDTLQVLQQVFQVLVDLPGNRGLGLVVAALNDRVRAHIGHPLMPYDAEHNGMRAAFQKMLALRPAGVNVDEPMRQLARAAARYLTLIGAEGPAAAAQIQGPLADSYRNMTQLSHQIIGHAQQQFGAGGGPPPPIGNALNWPQFAAAGNFAQAMLIAPPFNFAAAEVAPAGQ